MNGPLPEIGERAKEEDRNRSVIVCCASGTRSALAAHLLRGQGFMRVLTAGPWRSVGGSIRSAADAGMLKGAATLLRSNDRAVQTTVVPLGCLR